MKKLKAGLKKFNEKYIDLTPEQWYYTITSGIISGAVAVAYYKMGRRHGYALGSQYNRAAGDFLDDIMRHFPEGEPMHAMVSNGYFGVYQTLEELLENQPLTKTS